MYLMFLAVTEAGSLDTICANNLTSLLGLFSNFWKKLEYLEMTWFLKLTKPLAK